MMTAERIAELRRLLAEAMALTGTVEGLRAVEALNALLYRSLPELLDAAERAIALEAACVRKDAILQDVADRGDWSTTNPYNGIDSCDICRNAVLKPGCCTDPTCPTVRSREEAGKR